jgi:hypothetical protein
VVTFKVEATDDPEATATIAGSIRATGPGGETLAEMRTGLLNPKRPARFKVAIWKLPAWMIIVEVVVDNVKSGIVIVIRNHRVTEPPVAVTFAT